MDLEQRNKAIFYRIQMMNARVNTFKESDLYFYNQPIEELRGGARVIVSGREMDMYASYSYLGLIGHPRINAAAKAAVDKYGTGTHGVRSLAGSLPLHEELEEVMGGKWAFEPDPEKATKLMINHINKKRAALGLDKKRERVLYDMAMRRDLDAV